MLARVARLLRLSRGLRGAVLGGALGAFLAALLLLPPVAATAGELDASEIAKRLMMQREAAAAPRPAPRKVDARGAASPTGKRLRPGGRSATINLEILFASGSADITPAARRQLSALCRALQADLSSGPRRYQIVGHTDAAGDARENLILSQSRAESVARWLSGPDCGLDGRRLTPVGMGETRLKTPHDPDAAANRRVEIQSLS